MAYYRAFDWLCNIAILAVLVSFVYWWFYPDIHELIEQLKPIDWSVL